MLTAISQNSAVNIYEQYFDELEPAPIAKKSSARMVQCYHHPSAEEKSSANHISFAPEGGKEMIVAYANVIYRTKQIEDQSSYIWNLGVSNLEESKAFYQNFYFLFRKPRSSLVEIAL